MAYERHISPRIALYEQTVQDASSDLRPKSRLLKQEVRDTDVVSSDHDSQTTSNDVQPNENSETNNDEKRGSSPPSIRHSITSTDSDMFISADDYSDAVVETVDSEIRVPDRSFARAVEPESAEMLEATRFLMGKPDFIANSTHASDNDDDKENSNSTTPAASPIRDSQRTPREASNPDLSPDATPTISRVQSYKSDEFQFSNNIDGAPELPALNFASMSFEDSEKIAEDPLDAQTTASEYPNDHETVSEPHSPVSQSKVDTVEDSNPTTEKEDDPLDTLDTVDNKKNTSEDASEDENAQDESFHNEQVEKTETENQESSDHDVSQEFSGSVESDQHSYTGSVDTVQEATHLEEQAQSDNEQELVDKVSGLKYDDVEAAEETSRVEENSIPETALSSSLENVSSDVVPDNENEVGSDKIEDSLNNTETNRPLSIASQKSEESGITEINETSETSGPSEETELYDEANKTSPDDLEESKDSNYVNESQGLDSESEPSLKNSSNDLVENSLDGSEAELNVAAPVSPVDTASEVATMDSVEEPDKSKTLEASEEVGDITERDVDSDSEVLEADKVTAENVNSDKGLEQFEPVLHSKQEDVVVDNSEQYASTDDNHVPEEAVESNLHEKDTFELQENRSTSVEGDLLSESEKESAEEESKESKEVEEEEAEKEVGHSLTEEAVEGNGELHSGDNKVEPLDGEVQESKEYEEELKTPENSREQQDTESVMVHEEEKAYTSDVEPDTNSVDMNHHQESPENDDAPLDTESPIESEKSELYKQSEASEERQSETFEATNMSQPNENDAMDISDEPKDFNESIKSSNAEDITDSVAQETENEDTHHGSVSADEIEESVISEDAHGIVDSNNVEEEDDDEEEGEEGVDKSVDNILPNSLSSDNEEIEELPYIHSHPHPYSPEFVKDIEGYTEPSEPIDEDSDSSIQAEPRDLLKRAESNASEQESDNDLETSPKRVVDAMASSPNTIIPGSVSEEEQDLPESFMNKSRQSNLVDSSQPVNTEIINNDESEIPRHGYDESVPLSNESQLQNHEAETTEQVEEKSTVLHKASEDKLLSATDDNQASSSHVDTVKSAVAAIPLVAPIAAAATVIPIASAINTGAALNPPSSFSTPTHFNPVSPLGKHARAPSLKSISLSPSSVPSEPTAVHIKAAEFKPISDEEQEDEEEIQPEIIEPSSESSSEEEDNEYESEYVPFPQKAMPEEANSSSSLSGSQMARSNASPLPEPLNFSDDNGNIRESIVSVSTSNSNFRTNAREQFFRHTGPSNDDVISSSDQMTPRAGDATWSYKYEKEPITPPSMADPPIVGVCVVGFHHQRGPEVEYWIGPDGNQSQMWPYLPFQSLPDGSHQFEENVCYFDLLYDRNHYATTSLTFVRDEEGQIKEGTSDFRNVTTLFAIACSRQINTSELENQDSDYTRSIVQKSVVVIATTPMFGPIKEKLLVVTRSYFDQRDFNDKQIIDHFYENLVQMPLWAHKSDLQVGMHLQQFIQKFGTKALQILKAMLLEQKILFYASDTEILGTTQFALISLVPDLINHLQDSGSPLLSSYEVNLKPDRELSSNDRSSLLRYVGLPLQLFAGGGVLAPFVPLQQFDDLLQPETRYGMFGTTNNLFLTNKIDFDLVVDIDKNSIDIRNPQLNTLLKLTNADKAFAKNVANAAAKASQDEDDWKPQSLGYIGGEDHIRYEYEVYFVALLASAKFAGTDCDKMATWGSQFYEKWQQTNNYRIFNKNTDPSIHTLVANTHPGVRLIKPSGIDKFWGLFKQQEEEDTRSLSSEDFSSSNNSTQLRSPLQLRSPVRSLRSASSTKSRSNSMASDAKEFSWFWKRK